MLIRRRSVRKHAPKRSNAPRRRKAAKARRTQDFSNYATVVENVNYSSMLDSGQSYTSYNTTLLNTVRARDVARGFKYFRIKSITFLFKPSADTFTVGSSVPYLYFKVDKNQSDMNISNANMFRAAGVKPIRMDEKIIKKTFKPSILMTGLDNQPAGSYVWGPTKTSPWLPTDQSVLSTAWTPSEIDHLGAIWQVEQPLAQNPYQYSVEKRIVFEFKGAALGYVINNPGPDPKPFEELVDGDDTKLEL